MKILKTTDIRNIYHVMFYSKDNSHGVLWSTTETVEDAYDISQNFLNDTYNLTKTEVVNHFKDDVSDYIILYDENKISYFDIDPTKELKQYQYYFKIVKTSTVRINDSKHIATSQTVKWMDKMFQHCIEHNYIETYWAIDLHGTISIPDYHVRSKNVTYYPYAKEVLQYLSNREDIILILNTSSFPNEIEEYLKIFEKDEIKFNYVNENPEVSDKHGNFGYYEKKMYFNVLIDDKAGFDPFNDWMDIYNYFNH